MVTEKIKPVNRIREAFPDRVFNVINLIIMFLMIFIYIWPLWFVVIASFSDPMQVQLGNVLFTPIGFSVASYK